MNLELRSNVVDLIILRVYRYGMQTLFRYFSYGLEKHFDIRRWRDFQELAITDSEAGVW